MCLRFIFNSGYQLNYKQDFKFGDTFCDQTKRSLRKADTCLGYKITKPIPIFRNKARFLSSRVPKPCVNGRKKPILWVKKHVIKSVMVK